MQNGEDLASYNMGNAKKEDDDNQNEIQLHRIKQQEHFIEAQVQEGDTLQAIALRFYCPVSINLYHGNVVIVALSLFKIAIVNHTKIILNTNPSIMYLT